MVNSKQPGHIVTLIILDTLYFFTELVSSHLHMKTQSTWATRLNTSPQFPSNKIHFEVPTTLEGKSHLEGETFPCIHQSQSHFHLNCAFGDMTLVLYPWDMLFSSFEHPTISHLPKRYPYSRHFLLSKHLGSQTNLPTSKKWQLQKLPMIFLEHISICWKLRTIWNCEQKQERLGNHTTVGAAKVGGGGSCPGCTITPTSESNRQTRMWASKIFDFYGWTWRFWG